MIDTDLLKSKAYGFIQSDKHLGRHVILLGLAGSYSYGTNNEKSDIDVRGEIGRASCRERVCRIV